VKQANTKSWNAAVLVALRSSQLPAAEHSAYRGQCANITLKTTLVEDPEIAKLIRRQLPDLPIKVLHVPDGKGSNYIFSDFLSKSARNSTPKSERSLPKVAWAQPLAGVRICLANIAKTLGQSHAELRCGEKYGLSIARSHADESM